MHFNLNERKFLFHTNHCVLLKFCSASSIGRRPLQLHRWSDRVLQYNFDIEYTSGSTNQMADYLSRVQYDANDVDDMIENDIIVFVSTEIENLMIFVITMYELATCVDSNET